MPKLAERKDCTGCAACCGSCRFDALRMIPDNEGFLRPSIDTDACCECGECTKKCPVVTYSEITRFNKPDIYAVQASDDVRKYASSGGVFPLLARWMLSRGGMVAGAVIDYTDGLHVKHVMSDEEATVRAMASSKYVQSEISARLYSDIYSALKDGRDVLFSGCPCQVAGIYAYLAGRKFSGTLYTMDFFCHGVPSPAIYEKYLREKYGDRFSQIERFDFRDKSVFGWSTCINVYFKDGTEEHVHMDVDPYYQMFLPCAIQRPSCSVCMFSSIPRRADISVGDFWGCEDYDEALDDDKGTSFALVNSELGRKMFSDIKSDLARLMANIPLEAILPANPTPISPFEAHPGREHIFRFREVFDVDKLADHGLHGRYDVGVISKWYVDDISALSTYALVKMIERSGRDAVVLEKPGYIMQDEWFYDDVRPARRFIRNNCFVTSRRGVSWQEMEYNETCGRFVFLTDAPAQEVAFASRTAADEQDYFAGCFVSPTKAKKMLDGSPTWMPALALGRGGYEEIVAKARKRVFEFGDAGEVDPITLFIADVLNSGHSADEKEYVSDDVLPVLVSLACSKPFLYTGSDAQLLDLLASLGANKMEDGIGISANASWEAVREKLDELRSAYEAELFAFLDAPHEYSEDAAFTSRVMSEALEAHRKSDALRNRVEELERIVGAIGASTTEHDGLIGEDERCPREHGTRALVNKAIDRLYRRREDDEDLRDKDVRDKTDEGSSVSFNFKQSDILQQASYEGERKQHAIRNLLGDVAHMRFARFGNEQRYEEHARANKRDIALSKSNKTYDVGIVGLWYGKNYGSILTYYALYQLVEQLGYDAIMLDKPPALWDDSFNDPNEIAQQFIRSRCSVMDRCERMPSERIMNRSIDTFLLGSDVVWNYDICGREAGHFFFLDFVGGSKKKVAFASSLGGGLDNAPFRYKRAAAAYLRDFDYVSVREANAVGILSDQFRVSAEYVLDPVFLLNQNAWNRIADGGKRRIDSPYIMSYILGPNEDKKAVQDRIERSMRFPTVTFKNPNDDKELYIRLEYSITADVDVEDWVRCVRECSLFLGDSFHGLCFSLIFERPFIICVNRDIVGLARFESLLEECGLSNRLIFEDDLDRKSKIDKLLKEDIDWNDVRVRLEPHKERSKKWLEGALGKKKRSFWQKHAK